MSIEKKTGWVLKGNIANKQSAKRQSAKRQSVNKQVLISNIIKKARSKNLYVMYLSKTWKW